jgi:Fe-S-cluster-containing dehydrogenase component
MNIMRRERGQYPLIDVAYLPTPCMQCEDPDCMKEANDEAIYKRDDGIIIIDPEKAKGQKAIVDSCPYGVIYWNDVLDVPQKCNFCAHLLDNGWKEPRCVQACPTGALKYLQIEDAEMEQIIDSEKLEVLHPEYRLQPRVYYKNLYRYMRCFVGGSIATEVDGVSECVEEAIVALFRGSTKINETISDAFGDFKLDDLERNSGSYKLEFTYPGKKIKTLEITLKNSLTIGTIWL